MKIKGEYDNVVRCLMLIIAMGIGVIASANVADHLGSVRATVGETADLLYEVTEAYEGAILSLKHSKSSPKGGEADSVYHQAHNKASPQSGDVYIRYLDKEGNIIPSSGEVPILILLNGM